MKSDSKDIRSFSARSRAKRAAIFADLIVRCGVKGASVLDLGGTIDFWRMNLRYIPPGCISRIDVVNLPPMSEEIVNIDGVVVHAYAGNALDGSTIKSEFYDIVYSNSVIEHVGSLKDQKAMADIIMKSGSYYWVQTPARSFPIEPHFYFIYFHLLPLSVRTLLHQFFTLGYMQKNADWLDARIECEDTRLMTHREVSSVFKGCSIIKERFLGICKSHIATNLLPK